MKHLALPVAGALLLALLSRVVPGGVPESPATATQEPAAVDLVATLEEAGIGLDVERGLVAIPARVLVRDDLLEYLLVNERGQTHESMFVTAVQPSLLNVALLALGAEPGRNARIEELPRPPEEEADEESVPRRPPVKITPPEGNGFLLYAAWREGEETFLHRVDDLVSNLDTRRSLRRHRWVYLGSRFAQLRPDEEEKFIADLEGNLINISFFYQGNTLLTAARPECVEQTIWVANGWLLPPREAEVTLLFARERIDRLPAAWAEALPEADAR